MATTVVSSLIDPEVFGQGVEAKLGDNVKFMAVADIDSSLEGQPGDTISLPKFGYIGAATVVAENGEITPAELTETKVDKKVNKYAKAVQITDEAALSGYGDPVGEAETQVARAIDDATDQGFVSELANAPLEIGCYALNSDVVVDALSLFGEDEEGQKAIFVHAKELASLRKDDDYVKASDIGQDMLLKGATGQVWGCDIINSNRLKGDAERNAYIVKPGALSLINKRGIFVEIGREELYQRSNIVASAHRVPMLKDDSKVVKIRIFESLEAITSGITSVAGTSATNGTILKIDEPAPIGFKWKYKLGTADVTPTFGTAVTSYTDYVSDTTEIAASTNTKASVVLVDKDNKPVKYANVTLVKKA